LPTPPGPTRVESEKAAGRVVEETVDRGQLLRPADERGPWGGEVGAAGFEGPQRRELARQAVGLELEDPFGDAEVLQPVRSEVPRGQIDESPRRLREQHLAAVPDGRDAGGAVDVDPDVAFRGQVRLARMEPHPDLDRAAGQRPLGVYGRPDGVGGPSEGDEEGIALGIDLDPAVSGDGPADDPTMLRQSLVVGVAEIAQQPRRTLDVGEQEGDHTGRQQADHR